MSGMNRKQVNEVIVDLIRRANKLHDERGEHEPESVERIRLEGKRDGIEEALTALAELDDWDLPEWGIGLENITTGEWEWYYPRAISRGEAIEKAIEEAEEDLGKPLNPYEVNGPMPVRSDGGVERSEDRDAD